MSGVAPNVQALFSQAIGHHQAGRLGEAERLYRRILSGHPRHADSLNLLGVIGSQLGHHQAAAEMIAAAIAIEPGIASYHFNLGLALDKLGHADRAIECWRHCLALDPTDHAALTALAAALQSAGRWPEAASCWQSALVQRPDDAELHTSLGVALAKQGRASEAEACHRRALDLRPDFAAAHSNLGLVLQDQGRLEQAVTCFRRAVELTPEFPAALVNLGNALRQSGALDEAIARYGEALALEPNSPDALNNLGNALQDRGELDRAAARYGEALALKPDFHQALTNLANTLQRQGRLEAAVARYNEALAIEPRAPEVFNNLGNALQDLGRLDQAVVCYRRALAIDPGDLLALTNLANALKRQGRLDEALACCAEAVRIGPDCPDALANLVHLRQHLCDWGGLDQMVARLLDLVARAPDAVPPFSLLAVPSRPEDQLASARAFGEKFRVAVPLPAAAPRAAGGRIRLGYLSADFHQHATAYLIAELIERHARSRFEVVGYSFGPDDSSPMRRRLKAGFDRFVDLAGTSHGEAAGRIRQDGIDILVDLKGYTDQARTAVMALRPAPVQVNFLGYPGSMGVDFIDYIIADSVCIPPGDEGHYSEAVVRLPDSYQPNDRRRAIAAAPPGRADSGLPARGLVFCSFNNSFKITPQVFDIWMRLLDRVPGSVLWQLEANSWVKANLRREAAARGIDPDRLVFAPRLALADHLARHRLADLFLDTLPCNAHTTASDALWAGLPVLTCRGATFAGRVAASLLTAAGLPELIASSLEEYERLALDLATRPAALEALRDKLRRNRDTCALFDCGRTARHIEAAYGRMWETHRAGGKAAAFDVGAIG